MLRARAALFCWICYVTSLAFELGLKIGEFIFMQNLCKSEIIAVTLLNQIYIYI